MQINPFIAGQGSPGAGRRAVALRARTNAQDEAEFLKERVGTRGMDAVETEVMSRRCTIVLILFSLRQFRLIYFLFYFSRRLNFASRDCRWLPSLSVHGA